MIREMSVPAAQIHRHLGGATRRRRPRSHTGRYVAARPLKPSCTTFPLIAVLLCLYALYDTIQCITRAFWWLRTRYDVLRRATAARGRRRRHRDSDRAGAAGGWPPWCCGGRRRPSRKVRTRLQTASISVPGRAKVSTGACTINPTFQTMHDWYLPT